ncbi:helix-turn-helix domain-containing protein [Aquimarina sp. 2201CG5-10]|uniref:helix-turn-helix domain-containing protein n=1 Tax=Aquimarina callyspongiae TaxID=3098150 RepID=UPI002AB55684|nr:helix-turn-helix domain-containing protein [Aquimarina sp. 2201CG5-10]MDY8137955.1 helix-turn-helix domain-containing protein [Aquimarina sp. 2201CG5-10]
MFLFLDFMLVAGITVTIIILFLILKQRNKQLPHIVLAVFFVIILCIIINLYTDLHKIKSIYFISYIPHDIARWLLGPLLFIYVKSLFLKKKDAFRALALHFAPVVLYGIFISIPTLITLRIEKLNFEYLYFFNEYSFFVTQLSNSYTIIYFIISYVFLSKYSNNITAVYANISKRDIRWISYILIGGSILISLNSIIEIYQNVDETSTNYSNLFTLLGLIFFILYLGYYGVHQSKILLPDFLFKKNTNKKASHFSKEEEVAFSQLKSRLESVLDKEKLYLDNELTLIKLAEKIATTDKKLSALLNQYMQISFYDIINRYRTEAVKKMIDSDSYKDYTLLGIAYECGFNSKASFNRIFKKETGLSPSQYKNR